MAARSLTRDLVVEAAVNLVDAQQLYDIGPPASVFLTGAVAAGSRGV